MVQVYLSERDEKAAELRRMFEELWRSKRVVNAHRTARYVAPIRLGSDHGYQDELFAE